MGQDREPLGTSTPVRPRPYLLAVEISPLLSQPSSRSNALPLRQFVKDWFGPLADHGEMVAGPLPAGCPAGHAVRIATVVHALCDLEGLEPPAWVFDHRFEVDEMLHDAVLWDGEMGEWARKHAPPACEWHRCWFGESFFEVLGVHGRCSTAAALVLTARAAAGVSAAELAQAAGCELSLVADIEEGLLDPTLDTVERLVNAIGLELRAGSHSEPSPAYGGVAAAEVERVRALLDEVAEFRHAYGLRPAGPPRGVQPEWDGRGSAPPRLFGAGPTRRDGGGWAAILVSCERAQSQFTLGKLADATEVSTACATSIEDGTFRPPLTMVEDLLSAMGTCLRVRLEPYDDHDDGLHLQALADPERYQRRLANGEKAFATALVVD